MEISIIIPVYNAEKYLKECLDSALVQTVKNREIICIDDGSTDNSALILQEYASEYEEIKVICQENKGAGEARNAGLKIAKGNFVCFLDADDYYLDRFALEKMIKACKEHKVKVCGSFRKIKDIDSNVLKEFELHREICKDYPEGVYLNYFDYQDDYHYQNYIFDLEMIKNNHIIFPAYRRYQDPPFFVKAMLIAQKMWIMPVELYCLRLGHQNFELYGKLISHTLMGIRDNMKLAKKYNLYRLQKRLISRINIEFYSNIINNIDRSILNILVDIDNNIIEQSSERIRPIKEILNFYELSMRYSELSSSYYIMRMFVESRYKGINIIEFLYKIKAFKIAIYGLGTFGTALYNELKESKIKIICGIDLNKKVLDNLPVISDAEGLKNCDAVIVTPLKDGEDIARELRRKLSIPVYTLINILNEMEKLM